MQQFEGKTAVITGGASGIGFALAERFANARMNVVLGDIEADALEQAVKRLEEKQHSVRGVVTDCMRKESVAGLAERATEEFGNIHVLCNNAGVASGRERGRPVWEIGADDWQWVMGVNFWGVLYGLQEFVPRMLAHGEEGHIVNTASLAGLIPGGGPYSVSKHGVLTLSEGLHGNLEALEARIGASVLCPGFVNTQIMNAERNRPADLTAEEAPESLLGPSELLSRGKQPEEIADIVFAAIENEEFYILPHPAWDDTVRRRVECVLKRKAPMTMDFEGLLQRMEAGEQL